jgi:hypothetical protein
MRIVQQDSAGGFAEGGARADRPFDCLLLHHALRARPQGVEDSAHKRVVQEHQSVVEVLVMLGPPSIMGLHAHFTFGDA